MTGTAAELTPVREVDDRPVGTGRAGGDHAHAAERVRGRAARPLGPVRGVARRRELRLAGAGDVTRVTIYDCTLRDGMQGEGMSLSAQEKVRVAHVLDQLGVPLIEAGFPASNPKEAELFELLAGETFETAAIAAFGMTRRRDVAAEDDEALRLLADSFAPVCTIVGKTWSLHLEKVVRVGRDENLRMIEESVAFLVRPGQDASSTTPSTSSTAGATTRTTRCAARAPRRTAAPRGSRCATRTAPRSRTRSRRRRRRSPRSSASRSASTATTTRSAASPTRSPRCARARRWSRAR